MNLIVMVQGEGNAGQSGLHSKIVAGIVRAQTYMFVTEEMI